MSILPVKPAYTAVINDTRYIIRLRSNEWEEKTGLHYLESLAHKNKRWHKVSLGILITLTLIQIYLFFTNGFTLITTLGLAVNLGVLVWHVKSGKRNEQRLTDLFWKHEGAMRHMGAVTRVEDDDVILSHAYEILHGRSGSDEALARAQHIVNLAANVSLHRGMVLNTKERIEDADTEEKVHELQYVYLPVIVEEYESVQQEYLTARLDYNLSE